MGTYIVRRLLIMPLQLFVVSVVVFSLINLAPGDPVSALISPELPRSVAEVRREALGLNKPIAVRYVLWLGQVLQGNLGFSYVDRRPVATKIAERIGPTVLLMGAGLLIALLIGLPLGMYAAAKRYSVSDYTLTVGAFAAVSIPHFFLGLSFIYLLSLRLRIFPTGGIYTLGGERSLLDMLRHLILPACVLALEELGIYMRLLRGSLLEVLSADFVSKTARGKGLSERAILLRHALPNSLLPVITRLGLTLAWVFCGALVTEQVFQWPGIGMLTIESLNTRDYPVIMGINLVASSLVVIGNLLADVMYGLVDPRIRFT